MRNIKKYEVWTRELPAKGSGGNGRFPWDELKVGDGFTITASEMTGKAAHYSPTVPSALYDEGYRISIRKNSATGDKDVYRVA